MDKRSTATALLDASVTRVRLVSDARAKFLRKMHVTSVRDLLVSYPNRYIDLGHVSAASAAPIGEVVTVVGVVEDVVEKQPRKGLNILEVALVDDSGLMLGVWFRQPWMAKRFRVGARVAFTGKVVFDYGFKKMNSPHVEMLDEQGDAPAVSLVPVHPTTEGITPNMMRRLVANAVELASDLADSLPASLRLKYGLMSKKAALRGIHFPHDAAERDAARRRLAYEEVLYLQLEMMQRRDEETQGGGALVHTSGERLAAFRAQLPFELTEEQERAVADIMGDMCSDSCMNRMLLGDVGTGKTVVAAFALVLAADSAMQAAMMAPTEVLARQYAEKLGPALDNCGVSWGILTGSTPAEERKKLLEGLEQGSVAVVFGTHALIEPGVRFARLSLVVIDEQHRFGVNQRAALRMKGPGSDLLVMTATPIPRTLALALYGDLETSYIRKRPASRPATTTRVISRDARGIGYEAIREALAAGRQAYIVCPLVGLTREQRASKAESGDMQASLQAGRDISDAKAAEQEADFLQRKVFPNNRIGLLTGRMAPSQKQAVMQDFRAGKTDVLVSTTVIEVGIDVPNATVMMVEDAERFGLSQLHQLRGRVGRGQHAGKFFLVADPGKDDDELRARMDALVSTNDGFELAVADLRARREGDVLGSRQHGLALLRLVNVVDDAELIERAHADAATIMKEDPNLELAEHRALALELEAIFGKYDENVAKGA